MAKLSSTQIYGDLIVDGEIKNKATTTTEGVVQLSDAIDNTSTTQGATANAVKTVNDSLSAHKTDTTSHITESERTTWNSKASQEEVNSLKSSVSNGKQLIATAITGKGISATGSDDFSTLGVKISSIPQWTNTTDATALASDLLSSKTAYVNGAKITGTMVNRGAISTTLYSPSSYYTIPQGYHNGTGKVTCSSSLLTLEETRRRMAYLMYYTLHYAFDSSAMISNANLAYELLGGSVQSGYISSTAFSSNITLYLEGYQVLFIYGGGYVTSHTGITNDECGLSTYKGYFFNDIGEEYSVILNNNGKSCYYYIFNF